MNDQVERWIEERLATAPPELRDRMTAALRARDGAPKSGAGDAQALAARLRQIGDRLLEEAACGTASAETALTLLAADGFATLALELLAERDPAALGEAT